GGRPHWRRRSATRSRPRCDRLRLVPPPVPRECATMGAIYPPGGPDYHHAVGTAGVCGHCVQADLAAAGYADPSARRHIPDRYARARSRAYHQPYPQGSLVPAPSDRCAAIWRRRSFRTLVGPAGQLLEQSLICSRRTVRRVLDARARRTGAAALASGRLWGGAHFRHRPWRIPHGRRGALFLRRRFLRRSDVRPDLGDARPDLPLASYPARRKGGRELARPGWRMVNRRRPAALEPSQKGLLTTRRLRRSGLRL